MDDDPVRSTRGPIVTGWDPDLVGRPQVRMDPRVVEKGFILGGDTEEGVDGG